MKRFHVVTLLFAFLTASVVLAQDSSDVRMVSRIYDYWHYAGDVDIQGDFAYVATGLSGLQILDISNPEEPEVAGVWATRMSPWKVIVSGDIACVCTNDTSSVAVILDISDPTHPQVISTIDSLGWRDPEDYISEMRIQDNILFASSWQGMYIFDLTDPHEPQALGRPFQIHMDSEAFAVQGDYMYLSIVGEGFREYFLAIFDISDVNNPVEIGRSLIESSLYGIEAFGDYVYTASYQGFFSVYDVSNPEEPEEIRTIEVECIDFNLDISDGYASVDDKLIDISNPAECFLAGRLEGLDRTIWGINAEPDYVFVVDDDRNLKLFDVSNLEEPSLTSTHSQNGTVSKVSLSGNNAFIANGIDGLRVVDVSDPESVFEIASYQSDFLIKNITLNGNLAYLSLLQDGNNRPGMEILDISTPDEPAPVGSFESIYVYDIVFSGDYAYLISPYISGVYTIETSDPSDISIIDTTRISQLDPDGYLRSLRSQSAEVRENLLYITGSEMDDWDMEYGAFIIYNIEDPTEPTYFNHYLTGQFLTHFSLGDEYAYVAYLEGINIDGAREVGVMVINLADPENLELVSRYQVPNEIQDMKTLDNILFIADGFGGLRVIDISDPAHLHELGFHDTPGLAMGVDIRDQYAYVEDYTNFSVYDCSQAMGVIDNDQQLPADFRVLSASPNPFNNSVTLRFEIDQPGEVLLNVFDLLGRNILSQAEFFTTGAGTMTVGASQLGSAGMYFAQVSVGGRSRAVKLVLLP